MAMGLRSLSGGTRRVRAVAEPRRLTEMKPTFGDD